VGKTLGLCMIVRDEAAVIDRCLASVRDRIDHWVICDTGSSDDTPERIEAALAGVPGELHRRPWVDFGTNRSEAVALARGKADYLLLLDADMVLEATPDFDLDGLDADAYLIRYEGAVDYRQALLVRGDLPWRYVGVTHEYLHADVAYSRAPLDTLTLRHLCDGANRAAKFERDRDLLRAHLDNEPDDSRAWFYLGQTYFDLGEWELAIDAYRRRVAMDGWEEETWYAGYKLALARQARGDAWPEVLAALLASWQARPERLEPLYVLARRCREAGEHRLGHLFSRPALDAPYPDDILFVEREVYRYLLAFEHAICCYWVGDHAAAIRANNRLLDLPDLPPDHVEAAIRNRRCSLDLRAPARRPEADERPRPRLVVVVPFYNPGVLLERAIESLDAQESPGERGFEVVLVDDGSTDGYGEAARTRLAGRPIGGGARTFLALPERVGAPAAVRRAVAERAAPEDVVVVLCGEDRLASPRALAAVADAYATTDCEATYGQSEHAGGRRGSARPFPDGAAFERFAGGGERGAVGPLLTFRAGLLRSEGGFPEPARPWALPAEDALAPPLFARAGFERVLFLDETLCVTSRFRWST
ncbi:MAG TPA: glycosyltransferase, partial [Thermoanaerobaculia bacterium]|nr:glycosyltransferase [Thermoanaerobaculia bacterium]